MLEFQFVPRLDAILEPAVEFLSRETDDPFVCQHVIVPTAGVQAWLTAELAKRLGTSVAGYSDGVIANVKFGYPGCISTLHRPSVPGGDGPWTVAGMTFCLLEVLSNHPHEYERLIKQAGGPLLAARRMADLFDQYHFRRPQMIRCWDAGTRALNPELTAGGQSHCPELFGEDRWQFELWRRLRERIAAPCPVASEAAVVAPAAAVLVAGLQSLSLSQIELLQRWGDSPVVNGETCRVQVLLVHPAPRLAARWAQESPAATPGLAPLSSVVPAPQDVDPLVHNWLKETRESQWLLASQSILPTVPALGATTRAGAGATLLSRLQYTVSSGGRADAQPFDATDGSLLIHRCHDMRRQAEVLHGALLHAFHDLPGLEPQDVVIVSPQIAALAPHLEAAFDRKIRSDGRVTRLPLQIADRGISEVSQGAELLVTILELIGSRCSADAILAIATHPLVLSHFSADRDVVDTWKRYVRRTRIRWGIDAAQRSHLAPGFPELAAGTWRLALQRMLLGALLPDGEPAPIFGVLPLNDVEATDLKSISSLIAIVGILEEVELASQACHSVADWCDRLELALTRLAGEQTDPLVMVRQELEVFRREALENGGRVGVDGVVVNPLGVPVPFRDLRKLLKSRLTSTAGRQSLRTGAITATSMIPLRGVPFRVICVAGCDGDAVIPREGNGNDLIERQAFLGDPDPRLDFRRGLLDCLLAASDRLVITCRGMDIKNNATLPLATPLAELVDFAARHGVPGHHRLGEEHSQIEVFHPRHATSPANFSPGQVLASGVWSHDPIARSTAANLSGTDSAVAPDIHKRPPPGSGPVVIPLKRLVKFAEDPLDPFIHQTLKNAKKNADPEVIPATLPLTLNGLERWGLRTDYLSRLLCSSDPELLQRNWIEAVRSNGEVPVLEYGAQEAESTICFVNAVLAASVAAGFSLSECQRLPVDLELGEFRISGELEYWHASSRRLVIVKTGPDFSRAKIQANMELLCLQAVGTPAVSCSVFNQREGWSLGRRRPGGQAIEPFQMRPVRLNESCGQQQACEALQMFCQLYQQSLQVPRGLFGKTAEKLLQNRNMAREAFLSYSANDHKVNQNELLVFGMKPDFDNVFPENDHDLLAFFRQFFDARRFYK